MTVYALMQYRDSSYVSDGVGVLKGVFATREEATARFAHFGIRVNSHTGRINEEYLLIELYGVNMQKLGTPTVVGAILDDGTMLRIIEFEVQVK